MEWDLVCSKNAFYCAPLKRQSEMELANRAWYLSFCFPHPQLWQRLIFYWQRLSDVLIEKIRIFNGHIRGLSPTHFSLIQHSRNRIGKLNSFEFSLRSLNRIFLKTIHFPFRSNLKWNLLEATYIHMVKSTLCINHIKENCIKYTTTEMKEIICSKWK